MRRNHVTRRTLLTALTTGIAAAPFASPLRRARAADPAAPRRLVIYWTPNGTVQKNFWPADPKDFKTSQILSPLAGFEDRMIVTKTDYGGTGDHKFGMPFSTSANPVRFADPGSKISIDQEIANALKGQTPVPSLVLCAQSKDGNERGYISANIDGSRNPPTKNPSVAWEQVFGPYAGGMPPAPDNLAARKSMLDSVIKDLEGLQTRLSAAEKIKLQSHLDAVRDLEKKLADGGTMNGCVAENLVAPETMFDYDSRTLSHLDLITAAFACDMTRVVSFMAAPAGHDNCGFGFIGVDGGMHGGLNEGWSHQTSTDGNLNLADEKMTLVHKYHAERLASLLTRLDAVPEGDGSVLDNTVVLWLNEVSQGNHGPYGVPVVIAGGLGGYLKTGQSIEKIDHGRMLITMANGMGHKLETFGEKSVGQLPELLA